MADLIVTEELLAYLVAQGVAQRASAAPSTTLPLIVLAPRDGAPLPRTGENDTITLIEWMPGPTSELAAYVEETFVDVMVRSRQNRACKLIHRRIRELLVPYGAYGGRKGWDMGSLHVESSTIWSGDQPLTQRQLRTEADPHRTYDRHARFRFEVRRKLLAGLTLP